MKKEYNVLSVIFVIALLIRILFVFISPIKIWDETVYANLGYDLSKNPFDYSFANNGWSDFVPNDWPKAGYRAPLLPYTISIFHLLGLEQLVEFLIPFVGALSVVALYLLTKKMFNKKVALCSSIILSFLPLHVYFSGKILTDVFSTFFLILTALFFWEGFENGDKKYKLLFGVFLALSVLSRYTIAIIIPIFPAYLIIRNRNLSFLKDKFSWLSIALFFIILSPLLVYSNITYGSSFGVIDHTLRAASYWEVQPWDFLFRFSIQMEMFSIISFVFLLSIIFIIFNKNIRNNYSTIFLLLWFFIFLIFISVTPHKEDRFLLPVVPSMVMISALLLTSFKKYNNFILFYISFILILSLGSQFSTNYQNSYTITNECFLEASKFLQNLSSDSVVITEQSPIVHYYSMKETHFYPNPFSADSIMNLIAIYGERPVYILISDYNNLKDATQIKEILDSKLKIVFRCPENGNSSLIYR
jgi:4-amino-4-deoxy-L-arabinose transferase-like glycosyltransferase